MVLALPGVNNLNGKGILIKTKPNFCLKLFFRANLLKTLNLNSCDLSDVFTLTILLFGVNLQTREMVSAVKGNYRSGK